MKRRLVALAIVASASALAAPAIAGDAPLRGAPTTAISIDWEMPARFGADADGDGLVDLPNTTEYVHGRLPGTCPRGCSEARFLVHLRASAEISAATDVGTIRLPAASYEWDITNRDLETERWSAGPEIDVLLPEGTFDVRLTVRVRVPFGSMAVRGWGTVVVDDILVAALGDSYASGEGNPEVADAGSGPQWAEGGIDPRSDGDHASAHRSTVAWPARVALELERRDPRSSVTFVSLASSGATIDAGLVGREGSRPPQVEALAQLTGDREVDVLLLSAGGNDIGFGQAVRELVDADALFDPICYRVDLANVWTSVVTGDWGRDTRLVFAPSLGCRTVAARGLQVAGLDDLPDAFDRLAREVSAREIVVAEYPDPTGGGDCDEIVGDALPIFRFHEIDRREQAEAVARILEPLNTVVREAAARHGWRYAGGVAGRFADGHGYCAPWPDYGYPEEYLERPGFLTARTGFPEGWYQNPGADRVEYDVPVSWYRTAVQAGRLQGPSSLRTTGTLHPNELGHAAIASLVVAVLDAD